MQCCLESLAQHCTRFLPVQCCPKSINATLHSIFFCALLFRVPWATLHKVFTCTMLPKEYKDKIEKDFFLWIAVWSLLDNIGQGFLYLIKCIKATLTWFFTLNCCLEPQWQHCIGYLPVQYCPRSTKTTLNSIFPVQCCLEPLRQHCLRFLNVLCCPKSIKTTLIRNFSYALLSGASWTTLHKGFTYSMSAHG